jgi:hypothetical protein
VCEENSVENKAAAVLAAFNVGFSASELAQVKQRLLLRHRQQHLPRSERFLADAELELIGRDEARIERLVPFVVCKPR